MNNLKKLDSEKIVECIQGEWAAVETYQKALDNFKEGKEFSSLEKIKNHHEEASEYLLNVNSENDFHIPRTSGAWGSLAYIATEAASFFGINATLHTLLKGEEHGLELYKSTVENSSIPLTMKLHIEEVLIPRQYKHIESLKKLAA